MSRTHRDKLNHLRREKRRSFDYSAWRTELPGFAFDYSDPINRYPRLRGGNMVMAPSVSGVRDDCRPAGGPDKDRQRRAHKRAERQAWKRSAWAELLAPVPDPEPPESFSLLDAGWCDWLDWQEFFEQDEGWSDWQEFFGQDEHGFVYDDDAHTFTW